MSLMGMRRGLYKVWLDCRTFSGSKEQAIEAVANHYLRAGWSDTTIIENDHVVYFCSLFILSCKQRFCVHKIRDSVSKLIDSTLLDQVISPLPHLFESAFIVEPAHLERSEVLMDEIAYLGYAPIADGKAARIAIVRPNGHVLMFDANLDYIKGSITKAPPPLTEEKLDEEEIVETDRISKNALRYLMTYAALLEAEKTPLIVDESSEKPPRKPTANQKSIALNTITYRVRITDPVRRVVEASHQESQEKTEKGTPVKRKITGHLKMQPCGPGGKMRKIIYVAQYDATRYLSDGFVTKVVT